MKDVQPIHQLSVGDGAIGMNLKAFAYASIALFAFQGCSASSQSAPQIGVYGLSSRRISGAESVRLPGVSGFSQVSVLVTVDVDGNVIDAKVTDDRFGGDASAALAAARNWKFRPQSFDGKPIQAVGEITIEFDPPEIPPDTSVPLPIAALKDVEITGLPHQAGPPDKLEFRRLWAPWWADRSGA